MEKTITKKSVNVYELLELLSPLFP